MRSVGVRAGDQVGMFVNEHYDLVKKLGEGAFGAVYRAKDKSSGVLVAIKIFKMTYAVRCGHRWGNLSRRPDSAASSRLYVVFARHALQCPEAI